MSATFECGDNTGIVSYLFGECDPDERAAIAAHLTVCPACTAELAALRDTRVQLGTWAPPPVELGFRIVGAEERPAVVLRPARWWQQPLPGWAQAAAAVALFGVGLSLGVMRGSVQPSGSTTSRPAPAASVAAVSQNDLAALEERLRGEMAAVRTAAEQTQPPAAGSVSDAQLLAQVRALIEESEMRQRRELALRTQEIVRDIDAQRQFDWARVQRALGQSEGTTGAEIQRQRQELNNLIRVVSQRPQ